MYHKLLFVSLMKTWFDYNNGMKVFITFGVLCNNKRKFVN